MNNKAQGIHITKRCQYTVSMLLLFALSPEMPVVTAFQDVTTIYISLVKLLCGAFISFR